MKIKFFQIIIRLQKIFYTKNYRLKQSGIVINKKPVKGKNSGYLSYYSHDSAKACVEAEEIWLEITGLNAKIPSRKQSKFASNTPFIGSPKVGMENTCKSMGTTPIPKMRVLSSALSINPHLDL